MKFLKLQLDNFTKLLNTKKHLNHFTPFIEFKKRLFPNRKINVEEVNKPLIKWLEKNTSFENDWILVKNHKSLPKLPVPPLEQTIRKYKEKMKVLLNNDEYFHLEQITTKFLEDQNLGPKLQQFLLDRQKKLENWAYDYWLDDMYLCNRLPLPIYSNPAYINRTHTSLDNVCLVGAQIVRTAVMIKSLMEQNIFPKEHALKKVPNLQLCMTQYFKFFKNCRIPGNEKDHIKELNNHENNHIIVICRNNFYYVPIKTLNEGIDEEAIYYNLKLIKNDIKKYKSPSVGILTTLQRKEWSEVRNILMKNQINNENLTLIENAFLILCLDDPIKDYLNTMEDDDRATVLIKQSLHGGGSIENSENRWFDAAIQIILSENHLGICFEHSQLEGIVVLTVAELLLKNALKLSKVSYSNSIKEKIDFTKLKWVLDDYVLKSIKNASLKFDKLVNDVDIKVHTFKQYGSTFIKFHNYGPDGFVQLLLQLTYFKLYGKLCPTYETCSTRKFQRGRIDCIRATTPEAFEWVKEMVNSEGDNSMKLKLWKNAVDAQVKETKDVTLGHGIDIHLLGLREAAKEILDTVPELFTDKSYSIANKFTLSTSQTGSASNAVGGFGPLIDDGYGVHYSIYPNRIRVSVCSLRSCKTTSTQKFLEKLQESVCDVKTMIENV